MKIRELMNINLGALLFGRVETDPLARPIDSLSWMTIPFRVVASVLSFPFRVVGDYLFIQSPLQTVIEQLRQIVANNAPMSISLQVMSKDAPRYSIRVALFRLHQAMDQGCSLSEAMIRQPRFFPRYCIDLVRAGEETGTLMETFGNIIEIQENVRRTKQYFAGMLVAVCLIGSFLMIKVLPVFHDILQEMGGTPHGLAHRIMSGIEDASCNLKDIPKSLIQLDPLALAMLFGILLMVLVLSALFMPAGNLLRRVFSYLALRIPGLRNIVIAGNLGHLARLLGILLKAGYPLDEALERLMASDVRVGFTRMVGRLRAHIQQGQTLAAAMERESRLLPMAFRGMTAMGESAGLLPEALEQMADHYEIRYFHAGAIVSRFLLPLFILIAGGMVMLVYTYPFSLYCAMVDAMTVQF
jgi:type II secretory pathway component PulF